AGETATNSTSLAPSPAAMWRARSTSNPSKVSPVRSPTPGRSPLTPMMTRPVRAMRSATLEYVEGPSGPFDRSGSWPENGGQRLITAATATVTTTASAAASATHHIALPFPRGGSAGGSAGGSGPRSGSGTGSGSTAPPPPEPVLALIAGKDVTADACAPCGGGTSGTETRRSGVVSSPATWTPRLSSAVEALTVSGWPSSRSRIWSADGRSAGDFDSAACTTPRSGCGIIPTSTSWVRIRLSTIAIELPSNTVSPVAANAIVAPQANTSV